MAIPPEKNTRPEPVCPELSCPLDSAGSRAALFAGTGDSAARFSLGQFYIEATDSLCALYPRQEAAAIVSVLLQERLGVPAYLHITEPTTPLSPDNYESLTADLGRLLAAEPLQYVLGYAWFYGRRFNVNSNVLIPRPETELLVEQALALLKDRTAAPHRVLDLCTGSGCIAWTLALELSDRGTSGPGISSPGISAPDYLAPDVLALDISPAALAVASSQFPEATVRPRFTISDILQENCLKSVLGPSSSWDLIVSNPPYIMDSERASMRPNVLDHEPGLALFVPDDDPLRFYRAIARIAAQWLSERGAGVVEINERLPEQTAALFSEAGLHEVRIHNDLAGKPRLVSFCR